MVLVMPEQSQRPYRFGMTLLCVGALFNWLGLADTYSDPVPAIRYIGVGLIAAGASLICMAMCFWMRNIHDPNLSSEYDISTDPIRVISTDPSLEKPPDYSTVVDVPPCYEDAIKLSPAALASVHGYKETPAINVQPSTPVAGTADDRSSKPPMIFATHRSNSFQSNQSNDSTDCSTAPTECRQPAEKCDDCSPHVSASNSSQIENALAKVLRKSIRGIRKLRNGGGEDGNGGNCEQHQQQQPSHMENGSQQQDYGRTTSSSYPLPAPKVDR